MEAVASSLPKDHSSAERRSQYLWASSLFSTGAGGFSCTSFIHPEQTAATPKGLKSRWNFRRAHVSLSRAELKVTIYLPFRFIGYK